MITSNGHLLAAKVLRKLKGWVEIKPSKLEALGRRGAAAAAPEAAEDRPDPYSCPLQRRPTNLFVDNADYRGCGRLCDAWVALGCRADAENDDAIAGQWCAAFTRYLVLGSA